MLVMSEPGFDPALTEDERIEQQRRNRVRFAMLPPETYPRLVEAAGPMTACDDPEFHTSSGSTCSSPGSRRWQPASSAAAQ